MSLLLQSVSQRQSQDQPGFKGWRNRLYFSIGAFVKYCSCVFQFVEYFKGIIIMKMMRVMMYYKY